MKRTIWVIFREDGVPYQVQRFDPKQDWKLSRLLREVTGRHLTIALAVGPDVESLVAAYA